MQGALCPVSAAAPVGSTTGLCQKKEGEGPAQTTGQAERPWNSANMQVNVQLLSQTWCTSSQ